MWTTINKSWLRLTSKEEGDTTISIYDIALVKPTSTGSLIIMNNGARVFVRNNSKDVINVILKG